MAPLLIAYCDETAALPFVFGERDCALWVGEFVRRATGRDPVVEFRGRYHTAIGCRRFLRNRGGLVAIIGNCAMEFGMRRTNEAGAEIGSPGVVEIPVWRGRKAVTEPTAALKHPLGWAVFSPAGVIVGPMPVLAAWSN